MTRQLLVRLGPGRLPADLQNVLRDEVVLAGWVRANGVIADVTLRTVGSAAPRRLAGPFQAVVIEGSVGMAQGDVTCGLRAVLARETESGLETLAGEIVEARVIALEGMITALDALAATRSAEASTGLVFLDPIGGAVAATATATATPAAAPSAPSAPFAPAVASPAPAPAPAPAWADTVKASEEAPKPKPSPTFGAPAAMPQRIMKPKEAEQPDAIYPDAGDTAEHFAFGRCEVVKSDGDRLHVRLTKDQRIKEISLDMLKVTLLPGEEGQPRHFKLDRKL